MYIVSSIKLLTLSVLVIPSLIQEQNYAQGSKEITKLGYHLQLYNSINSYRTKHTIPVLGWNQTLTKTAEHLAARIVKTQDSFNVGEFEGTNFFFCSGKNLPSVSLITGSWYNESFQYDYSRPGYNPLTLNFTAMIWKSSKSVGIGSYTSNNLTSIVAKFYPAGNIKQEFNENVRQVYEKRSLMNLNFYEIVKLSYSFWSSFLQHDEM